MSKRVFENLKKWRILNYIIHFLRPPRPIKIEKSGWVFLLITIGVGVGALSSGNNLLFIIFGGLLSIIIMSGVLSDITLRNIQLVEFNFSETALAWKDEFFSFELKNNKRFFPSFDLNIEMMIDGENFEFKEYPRINVLLPQMSRKISGRVLFKKRGVYRVKGLKIFSEYPFGFFKKMFYMNLRDYIYVGPKPVESLSESTSPSSPEGNGGEKPSPEGDELRNIREYMPGDNPKFIHWKISARMGGLMVREMEMREIQGVVLKVHIPSSFPDWKIERILGKLLYLSDSFISRGIETGVLINSHYIPPSRDSYQFPRIVKATSLFPEIEGGIISQNFLPSKFMVIEVFD